MNSYIPQLPEHNPYQTPAEYQRQTGIILHCPINWNGGVKDEEICKETKPLICKTVGGKFEVRPDGVYLKALNIGEHAKHLCNFSFNLEAICRVISRDGTIHNELAYSVYGIDLVTNDNATKGNELPTIDEDRYEYLVDDVLKKYKECYIVTENRYMAKDYLKEFAAHIYREFVKRADCPVKFVFTYPGWALVNNKNVYLSDSRKGIDYECKCGISVPVIPREKLAQIWIDDLKILEIGKKFYTVDGQINYLESLKTILPFWLYLHIGFACKLFSDAGLEVQFIMILVGKTGSLKTTLCRTFAEIFNASSMLRFESTSVALENYMEQCQDQIMIVDDLFKEDASMKKKFEVLTRVFGDGIGRAKATGKDYKENIQAKVRGGCIVTAEHSPNAQQSSTLRYVVNELGKDVIDLSVLTEFQTDKQLAKLEHRANKIQKIFGGWIGFLESRYEELIRFLIAYQPPPIDFKFKRHNQIYKAFCAVAQMILKYGVESGAITEQQQVSGFEIWHEIIVRFILINQNNAKVVEPYQQFLMTLQQAIATGTVLVATCKDDFEKDGNRFVGFYRQDKGDIEYVLNPDKALSFVRRHLLDTGKELVSDSSTIWKELFEHGISKGYSNKDGNGGMRNRYFKRMKIHDSQAEMLVLSKSALEKTLENLLKEET